MDIYMIFMLLGGLAFFLYGMKVMSGGLEKIAGGKLEQILKKMTSNRFKGLLLGAAITAAIQSSSAITVMLVGLVNSGIMEFGQTIGVIMGSNIGTTMTAWLLSLSGIESDNVFLSLLKPKNFAPVLAFIGVLMIMSSKKKRKKDIGTVLVGFAVLLFGMQLMSTAVAPLADMPQFGKVLTLFKNPLFGVLIGAVITAIIQSSSASVGILQAVSLTGGLSYEMAIPIIMGQNIGTCATAFISSIGVNKNAKKVAVVHVIFNVIGTTLCLGVLFGVNAFVNFAFFDLTINPVGIAIVHSIFNITTTALLLPFTKQLEKLANVILQGKGKKEDNTFFDERLLATPSFAIAECGDMSRRMADTAKASIMSALALYTSYNEKSKAEVAEYENQLDVFEDKLGTVLVKLSSKELSEHDSKQISKLLHTIGNFERLGDHALNLSETAEEIKDKQINFSDEAKGELRILIAAITEIVDMSIKAFSENDIDLANQVEPLEQVIDGLVLGIKSNHIKRLQNGNCTINLGFVLADILSNCERISDHCSNIAVALIEVEKNQFDTHGYLNKIKNTNNQEFQSMFEKYKNKYLLKIQSSEDIMSDEGKTE